MCFNRSHWIFTTHSSPKRQNQGTTGCLPIFQRIVCTLIAHLGEIFGIPANLDLYCKFWTVSKSLKLMIQRARWGRWTWGWFKHWSHLTRRWPGMPLSKKEEDTLWSVLSSLLRWMTLQWQEWWFSWKTSWWLPSPESRRSEISDFEPGTWANLWPGWHRILGSSGRWFVQHCSFSNWVCEIVEGLPIRRRSRFKFEQE